MPWLLTNSVYLVFSSVLGLLSVVSPLLDTADSLFTVVVVVPSSGVAACTVSPLAAAAGVDVLPGTNRANLPPQPEQKVTEFWQELHWT